MKKQDLAAWRAKSEAEITAEVKRLRHNILKEDDVHAVTKQRRSVAQLRTMLKEKQTYQQSENTHE